MVALFLLEPVLLFEPLSLWSLWVPIALLALILVAAAYFVGVGSSR